MCRGGPPHNRRAESLTLDLILRRLALSFRFGLGLRSALAWLALALGIATSCVLTLCSAIGLGLRSLLAPLALAAVLRWMSISASLAALGVALGTLGALGVALAAFPSFGIALGILRRLASAIIKPFPRRSGS